MCPNEPVSTIFIFLFFCNAKVCTTKRTGVSKSMFVVAKNEWVENCYRPAFIIIAHSLTQACRKSFTKMSSIKKSIVIQV